MGQVRICGTLSRQYAHILTSRSLCASSQDLLHVPRQLARFTRLQMLSLDFYHEGLSTQRSRMLQLCNNLAASFYLTSLTITHLPRIDAPTLRTISHSFPELLDLYLSCTERLDYSCCWICYQESLGCTIHSPIPDTFPNGTMLGVSIIRRKPYVADVQCPVPQRVFAEALHSLTKLTHLFLGIFLSDEVLPYKHVWHCLETCCMVCEEELEKVRIREAAANFAFIERFKALKSIGWASFSKTHCSGDSQAISIPRNTAQKIAH